MKNGMEDSMKYWSKSALSVYRYLEQMSNTIDKLVLDVGKNSHSQNLQRYQTTMYQTGKIIEYMDRKRKIINLKVAIEDALHRLPKTERRILVLVFIDDIKSEVVAELLGFSLRTFFRRKLRAIEMLKDELIECGYDLKFFESEYSSEKWLASVYQDCLQKYYKDEEQLNSYLVHRMLKEVSRLNMSSLLYS